MSFGKGLTRLQDPLYRASPSNNYGSIKNPLQDDKILDWSKLKQIADDI